MGATVAYEAALRLRVCSERHAGGYRRTGQSRQYLFPYVRVRAVLCGENGLVVGGCALRCVALRCVVGYFMGAAGGKARAQL